MEEIKKQTINIYFKKNNYFNYYSEIKNKNFMFCCDILLLKDYNEFTKLIKDEYWKLDNSIMVIDTININNVEHFKYILEYIEIKNIEDVLLYCCKNKKWNIVEYLINNNPDMTNYQKYCNISAFSGLYLIKKYLNVIKLNTTIFGNIIIGGSLDNVKWLRGYRKDKKDNNIWKLDSNAPVCQWNKRTFYHAAKAGNFEIMKWMRGYRNGQLDPNASVCPWDDWTFCKTVENGNLEIMEWLLENNCPLTEQVLMWATDYSTLYIIKWLRGYRNGQLDPNAPLCPWGKNIPSYAAAYNNPDALKWVRGYRKNNNIWKLDPNAPVCPWDESTFGRALVKCGFETFEWLKDNNCPWNKTTIEYVYDYGYFGIDGNIEWMEKNLK